jgi:hypothetical protein
MSREAEIALNTIEAYALKLEDDVLIWKTQNEKDVTTILESFLDIKDQLNRVEFKIDEIGERLYYEQATV